MTTEDCIEGFLGYKEKVRCAHIKPVKGFIMYLSVVAFVFTLAYPENTVQKRLLDLVSQENPLDPEKNKIMSIEMLST